MLKSFLYSLIGLLVIVLIYTPTFSLYFIIRACLVAYLIYNFYFITLRYRLDWFVVVLRRFYSIY